MKICFLNGNLNNSGGTERVGSLIANGLSEIGHDIVMTSISGGEAPFFQLNREIKVTSLFNTPGRAISRAPLIISKLRKLLKEEKIDVLIVVESMSVLFSLPATLGLPVKHICWEHFNFKNDLGKTGRRVARQLAARFCDSVVTLTERDKQYWLDGTKHKNQITAIPNPCPFPVQQNSYSTNNKVVLAVGRLVEIKGYDLLLKAWIRVAEAAPDWQLKIVGEGEERETLTQFIIDNGLSDDVELVGNTDNVAQYYEQAAIFCLSSRFEGFPMVLLETLSFGLPVVSFDCDTGPEEVLNGTGSILVDCYETKKLAEGLITLIKDADLRKSISIKSKQKALEYQTDRIINKWVELLN